MKIVNPKDRTTLLLNNAWQPITVTTARAAFMHLLKGNISALDKNQTIFHSLETWNKLAEFYDDQPYMRSSSSAWPIPTIIVVGTKFFRKPKRKRLSLMEMAKLHNNTCQYCLEKVPYKQLTIDHIHPKSKGGTNDHDNLALACKECNSKKASFAPWFDINGNLPKPIEIPSVILPTFITREEWNSFLQSA